MIKTQFGIIDDIEETQHYSYNPVKYYCVPIDDTTYIDDWWDRLKLMKTYFHSLKRPEYGLARYGITLIPPESLPTFQDIVLSDQRIHKDMCLVKLAERINDAINQNKFMIHFGI